MSEMALSEIDPGKLYPRAAAQRLLGGVSLSKLQRLEANRLVPIKLDPSSDGATVFYRGQNLIDVRDGKTTIVPADYGNNLAFREIDPKRAPTGRRGGGRKRLDDRPAR